MITAHITYAQEKLSYTLPYFQLPDDFKNSPWHIIISIKQVALCANELIDLIDTAPSKRLPSGQDCIHGGYVVVSTSLYYMSLGFGNMMIDIDIQISISERSSGWATN